MKQVVQLESFTVQLLLWVDCTQPFPFEALVVGDVAFRKIRALLVVERRKTRWKFGIRPRLLFVESLLDEDGNLYLARKMDLFLIGEEGCYLGYGLKTSTRTSLPFQARVMLFFYA